MSEELPPLPPIPERPSDLQKLVKQLMPFMAYTCLFAIILLPFMSDMIPAKYISICFVLSHFSALLHKITKR